MTRPCTTHHDACDCREAAHTRELSRIQIELSEARKTFLLRAAAMERAHDRRVTELLEANNREVERRRIAERRIIELKGK